MPGGMELTLHLSDQTEYIIRMKANGHSTPVRRVDHHEKGMDLVMHGVIIEILYNADDMIGEQVELIIVIVEGHIERVLHAERGYGGFIEEDGGGIGRKLREVEVAAFDHLHAEGRNIMVVDPERGHEDRLPDIERGIREPALLPILAIDCGEVGGDGCVSDPCKGEQVLAKIGRTLLSERSGTMNNEYLIPIKADFLVSNIVKLAIDDEGADDEANGNKKLKDHEAASKPSAPKACGYLSFQYLNGLKGGKVEGRVAACETAYHQYQQDEDGQEPAAKEHVGTE